MIFGDGWLIFANFLSILFRDVRSIFFNFFFLHIFVNYSPTHIFPLLTLKSYSLLKFEKGARRAKVVCFWADQQKIKSYNNITKISLVHHQNWEYDSFPYLKKLIHHMSSHTSLPSPSQLNKWPWTDKLIYWISYTCLLSV